MESEDKWMSRKEVKVQLKVNDEDLLNFCYNHEIAGYDMEKEWIYIPSHLPTFLGIRCLVRSRKEITRQESTDDHQKKHLRRMAARAFDLPPRDVPYVKLEFCHFVSFNVAMLPVPGDDTSAHCAA